MKTLEKNCSVEQMISDMFYSWLISNNIFDDESMVVDYSCVNEKEYEEETI